MILVLAMGWTFRPFRTREAVPQLPSKEELNDTASRIADEVHAQIQYSPLNYLAPSNGDFHEHIGYLHAGLKQILRVRSDEFFSQSFEAASEMALKKALAHHGLTGKKAEKVQQITREFAENMRRRISVGNPNVKDYFVEAGKKLNLHLGERESVNFIDTYTALLFPIHTALWEHYRTSLRTQGKKPMP